MDAVRQMTQGGHIGKRINGTVVHDGKTMKMLEQLGDKRRHNVPTLSVHTIVIEIGRASCRERV